MQTAKEMGLGVCPKCHKVNQMEGDSQICVRCDNAFMLRKKDSIERTTAFTLVAIIALFPANIYPTMIFTALGNDEASTIFGGIITFIKMGEYPIAVIIFIASFIVPLGKILGLTILILGVRFKSRLEPEQRTKLYEIVEFLGPWSMLDVFVISLMTAVVQLGYITSILPGIGITFFTSMVIFTMFAAANFDVRLLWDEKKNDK